MARGTLNGRPGSEGVLRGHGSAIRGESRGAGLTHTRGRVEPGTASREASGAGGGSHAPAQDPHGRLVSQSAPGGGRVQRLPAWPVPAAQAAPLPPPGRAGLTSRSTPPHTRSAAQRRTNCGHGNTAGSGPARGRSCLVGGRTSRAAGTHASSAARSQSEPQSPAFTCIPSTRARTQRKAKGAPLWGCFLSGVFLEAPPKSCHFYLIGQDFITWSNLAAREAGIRDFHLSKRPSLRDPGPAAEGAEGAPGGQRRPRPHIQAAFPVLEEATAHPVARATVTKAPGDAKPPYVLRMF